MTGGKELSFLLSVHFRIPFGSARQNADNRCVTVFWIGGFI